MIIERNQALQVFKQYVSSFDLLDERVRLKINHTYHVVDIAEQLAVSMNWKKEDIELTYLISLLHDIGRFEQLRRVHGFWDHKLDHAEVGIEVLFQEGWIRKFIADDAYDDIIREAIRNHNRFEIESSLEETVLQHAKLIRDADKLDIFRVRKEEPLSALISIPVDELQKQMISDEVYECFLQHHCVRSSIRKTDMDCWVSSLAMVFDFNYSCSCTYFQKHVDLEAVLHRIRYEKETQRRLKRILYEIDQYIRNRKEL